jgi:diphosphomevalonate decarboxylase
VNIACDIATTRASATACANVALVKYFGKRCETYNLPAAGSLSVTLQPLRTTTQVAIDGQPGDDVVYLGDALASVPFTARVSRFLDLLRQEAGSTSRVVVTTSNNFPTAAGLASSASGFAALALAATHALRIPTTPQSLSAWARRGSGSAARSIPGGFVVWHAGSAPDGSDSFAESIAPPGHWDIALVIGIAATGPKADSSTLAMNRTRDTSPYYRAFIDSTAHWLAEAQQAVHARDIEKLGDIAEHSALAMHAATLAARPGILFFNPTTTAALHQVRQWRRDGIGAWFTCDAGPQPKVLCSAADAQEIAERLRQVPGIQDIITATPGDGATLSG